MSPERIQVVCLAVGDLPDEYVLRLHAMLHRHMPAPFDLTCLVDRERGFPKDVRTLDVTGWPAPREGMRPTTYKLFLYDPVRVPLGDLLYMDTSLIVQKDLTPLIEFAYRQPHELVAVKGLSYDTYNSCVLRIRQGGRLAAIPRAYEAGTSFEQKVPGDQDFAAGVIRQEGWEGLVTRFPDPMIQSYKVARRAERRGRGLGRTMLGAAIIVKFNGPPKMHELLDPRRRLRAAIDHRKPWHRDAWFWVRETRRHWR